MLLFWRDALWALLLPVRLPFIVLVKYCEWNYQYAGFRRAQRVFNITLLVLQGVWVLSLPHGHPHAQSTAQMQIQRDDNGDPRRPAPSTLQGSSFPGGAVLHDSNGNHVTCVEQPGWSNLVRCFGDR